MIQRFYVHNFRCLENFELPIGKKPSTLLIGRNGTGKTTTGLALEVLQRVARGTNRVGDLIKPTDFAMGRARVPIRFEIEVALDGQLFEFSLAFELPSGFKELRIAEERLAVDGRDIYVRDRAQVTYLKAYADRESKFFIDWHLVALPLLQVRSETDPVHLLKTWLSRMLILTPIPQLINGDSSDDSLMPQRRVANFGSWFSGLLAHSPASYSDIDRVLRNVMPDFKDLKNPIVGKDFRSLQIQFESDGASLTLPFEDLSEGEKCFFVVAVVIASNRGYGPLFCFWDEPDSYLSLSEIGHLVMDLRRSFESGGQLLVTSHNPEAISRFSSENTFLLHRRSHLEPTLVRPVTEVHADGDLVGALIRNDV